MSTGNIKDKLLKPFGPYIAREILDHRAIRRPPNKDKFSLESVTLHQGVSHVGLDDLDNGQFGDGSLVLFRGILTIVDKRWLTDVGRNWVQSDIDSRAGASYLKLDDCIKNYGIKLLVQDSLHFFPTYLRSTARLQIFSFRKNPDATYDYPVSSLNVLTYSRSRKFLSKYHALSMIETIIADDNKLPRSQRTALEGRTPKWLVDRYLEMNKQHFEDTRASPSHTPRHVHRSEVYTVFGRHAKWLAETIKKDKLLNVESWNRLCVEMRSRWSRLKSDEEEDQLQDWEELERLWDEPNASDSPPSQQAMDIDHAGEDAVSEELEYVSIHGSDVMEGTKSRSISPEPNDFFANRSAGPFNTDAIGDADVLAAIPKPLFCEQPVLQSNMVWFCPDPACSTSIDFLNLPDSVLENLDYSSRSYLYSRNWKVSDEEFIELFYDIVEQHYFDHLSEYGIKVVGFYSGEVDIFDQPICRERRVAAPRELQRNDHPKFKWIKPRNHRPAFRSSRTDGQAHT